MNKNNVRWSQREVEILKRWYPREGIAVKKRLKRRTKKAIQSKAYLLGLHQKSRDRRIFCLEEELYVIENYEELGTAVAKELGRTHSSVISVAKEHNLIAPNTQHNFTQEECEILKNTHSVAELCEMLPRHTKNSIIRKRIELGYATKSCVKWSEEEINILKKWYPIEGTKIVTRLNNRTVDAILNKVKKLGISYRNRR